MATNKKSARYIGITSTVAFRLQLDPDIYSATLAPILGVGNTLVSGGKAIDVSIAVATKSAFASLLKATVVKGEESRQIKLVCDADNADTARAALVGETVKLGFGANSVVWTIERIA